METLGNFKRKSQVFQGDLKSVTNSGHVQITLDIDDDEFILVDYKTCEKRRKNSRNQKSFPTFIILITLLQVISMCTLQIRCLSREDLLLNV